MQQIRPDLVRAAEETYGARMVEQNVLGYSANLIYGVELWKAPAILRISKYSRQKEAHIAFELSWMEFLSREIPQIFAPLPSLRGNLYEAVETENGHWLLCVFPRAPGHIVDISDPAEWNDALFQSMGDLMGRIHTRTRQYVEKTGICKELDWKHSFLFWPENNQWTDPDIQPYWEKLMEEMDALPRSGSDYGIVHGDFHYQNFHVENGNLTLFDFDDCEYHWYAYDIASTLFFAASTANYQDPFSGKTMLERFSPPFLRGYREHAPLPGVWVDKIGLFLRFRRLAQYKYFSNRYRDQPDNPYADYLVWAKREIIAGNPYLNVDYHKLLI